MKFIVELIRHGETDLQALRRYQGAVDVPLSEEGRRKLTAGREALYVGRESLNVGRTPLDPAVVYVSPLKRARETASILFPKAVQVVIPELSEMNFGIFEGRNYKEMENDPEYRAWVDGMCLGKCPGGESRAEFCSRTCDAFLEILRQAPQRENEIFSSHIVIVAHGGTQMALMNRFHCFPEDHLSSGSCRPENAGPDVRTESPESGSDSRKIDAGSGIRTEPPESGSDSRKIDAGPGVRDETAACGEGKTENGADDYYSWQLSCGQGYVLEVQTDGTECRIHVLGFRDYCAPQKKA